MCLACDIDAEVMPSTGSGGGTSATTQSTTSSIDGGTGGGASWCLFPADLDCHDDGDCDCLACYGSLSCMPDGCITDGVCQLGVDDVCTCSDCDWSPLCVEYGGPPCVEDGTCNAISEGCGCRDCQDMVTCSDNNGLCTDGAPNGICGTGESCLCSDCLGNEQCLCGDVLWSHVCICPMCWAELEYCNYPCNTQPECTDDALCDWFYEGCHCADCAALELCQGYPG